MDPRTQFTLNVQSIQDLPLDHPGAHDPVYRARRKKIAESAEAFWANPSSEIPEIQYTQQENQTWAKVRAHLDPLHEKYASQAYLEAKKQLLIPKDQVPQLGVLSEVLSHFQGVRIQPIPGLIDGRAFLGSFAARVMSCTQYLRHHSKPEYTPEPDIVHEVMGHVPMFVHQSFVDFSELLGRAALSINDENMKRLDRLYWFTIEFGLIEEESGLKAYGAGLLSSIGELPHALSDQVERQAFSLETVLEQDYDFSQMQKLLFVIPSFDELLRETRAWLNSVS